MMAHELPLLIHTKKSNHNVPPSKAPSTKTNRHKPVKGSDDRRLPNGAKADFGSASGSNTNKKNKKSSKHTSSNSSNNKNVTRLLPDGSKPSFGNELSSHRKQNHEPSLPNGEKPNFGESSKSKKKNNSNSEPALPNGEKPNFFNEKASKKTGKPKDKKQLVTEDTYAGSSFHSSPAALNLPKPSFKTSPKANNATQHTPEPNYLVNQPVNAPPQHPVTAYPTNNGMQHGGIPNQPNPLPPGNNFIQPGFSYYVTPQGYINYQYPDVPPPPGPPQNAMFPMMASPYQPVPINQPGIPPQQGQRITFNDLLGSSKN